MTTTFDLAALVLNGSPLHAVIRLYRDGQISDELFFDYVQLWRHGAFRFSRLYEEWDDRPLRPAVIGPLAAVAVNALLFGLAQRARAHGWRVGWQVPPGSAQKPPKSNACA